MVYISPLHENYYCSEQKSEQGIKKVSVQFWNKLGTVMTGCSKISKLACCVQKSYNKIVKNLPRK